MSTEVKRGQVWERRDDRALVRILHLTETHAVTGPETPRARARATRVRLDRFARNYRLIEEASG